MIGIVLLLLGQRQTIFFGANEGSSAELLCRYAQSIGVSFEAASSIGTSVTLETDKDHAQQVLKSFEEEFHVGFAKDFPSFVSKPLDYSFSIKASTGLGKTGLSAFAKDSLVLKSLLELEKHFPDLEHEQLVGGRYCLRPWLTPDLKRTETISAVFTFLEDGKNQDIHITYDLHKE